MDRIKIFALGLVVGWISLFVVLYIYGNAGDTEEPKQGTLEPIDADEPLELG